MKRCFLSFLLLTALSAVLLGGCGEPRSAVPFTDAAGHGRRLYALDDNAKKGLLTGPDATAWFLFKPAKKSKPAAIEVTVTNETGDPVQFSLALVSASDLTPAGKLTDKPAARNLSNVSGAVGITRIRMLLPANDGGTKGFALRLTGAQSSRALITAASLESPETGWLKTKDGLWAGFGSDGGSMDAAAVSGSAGPVYRPSVRFPARSLLTLYFDAAQGGEGSIEEPGRTVFHAGSRVIGFRKAPVPYRTSVPALLFSGKETGLAVSEGGENLSGMRVAVGKPLPTVDPANSSSPLSADPLMIIEWPVSAWRNASREIFSWDRFPSILIFDTADYDVQDRYFKRLAFFVEKQGYKGKLWTDDELSRQHAFNAHDYRAESLAAFFELARKDKFALNGEENELLGILLAEGVIRKDGSAYAPGAGAVLSFSRQSASYLRYMFMAHEGYHGIYFVDPDFRAKVAEVYRSMDARAVGFLESYFTIVSSLGYDTTDRYLMENEFMGYLMQQPVDKVAPYFTGTITERFLRYGGDPAMARYIAATDAAEFVRAARELNDYVFARWGICGGRNGLYFSD